MEIPICERLDKSTGGIHIDPVPDKAPNGMDSDCLVTFLDRHGVIDECKKNQKMTEVKKWVMLQIRALLPDKIANDDKFFKRHRRKFDNDKNPGGGFNPRTVRIILLDHRFTGTPTQGKFWFRILEGQ